MTSEDEADRDPNAGTPAIRREPADRESMLDQLRGANEQLVLSSMHAQSVADAARTDAETANRLKDEFLAIVSHELRTPLNAVLGWAHLLAGGQLDPKSTTIAIATIERNARMLERIVDDLLDVSRIIGGKIAIEARPIDIVAVIQGALDEVRPTADVKGVTLTFSRPTAPRLCAGDSVRLQQVIGNLLSNAVKFTPLGGQVEVRLVASRSEIEIQVADTGQGIAPDLLPRVFDWFVQADSSATRRQGGLGLGLAIVRTLVEGHGGTVRAESRGPGLGATFSVRLPSLAAEAFDEEGTSRPAPPNDPSIRLDGISVLVVDDEVDGREGLTLILQLAGARVVAVDSVRRALEVISVTKPDVLITDIGMPDEDGYALIRRVREHEVASGGRIPAMAVTGYVLPEDEARLRAAGFQHHLRKPINPKELIAAVASLAPFRC